MALRKYRSRYRRGTKRSFTNLVAFNTNLTTVNPNSLSVVPLLQPTVPSSQTSTTQMYQNLGRSLLAKTRFDFDVTASSALGTLPLYAAGAVGIYVDTDFSDPATSLRPLQDGSSSDWLLWHYFVLRTGAYGVISTPAPGGVVLSNHTDQLFRRFSYNLTRYKRKIDSQNDSLVMVVQNSAQSTAPITYTFYEKFLFLR